MRKPNPVKYLIFLMIVAGVLSGLTLLQDGLLLGSHEGDIYHFLDVMMRIDAGQRPHMDFVTPIGVLAFLPIAAFLNAGFGIGAAVVWSQIAVAAILLPAVWYAGVTRLGPIVRYVFGFVVLAMVLALVYGSATSNLSISMHYNRWAWALSFIAIVIAVLPSAGTERQKLDGALLGLIMLALALLKITFFIAFVVPVAVALIANDRRRALVWALSIGAVGAVAVTVGLGLDFWIAYLHDLQNVAGSTSRPSPGRSLNHVVASPQWVGATACAIAAVFLLRRAGMSREALVVLLCIPGFIFVTYQNFGNDPKWLMLLAILVLTLRPAPGTTSDEGWDMHTALTATALSAAVFILPSFANIATSQVRHLGNDPADYTAMLPAMPQHADFQTTLIRAHTMNFEVALDQENPARWAEHTDLAGRLPDVELAGRTFRACELSAGTVAWFTEIASQLETDGIPDDSQIFAADVLSGFWMFGNTAPLKGAAPWYYGGLTGLENADYVLVPTCPILQQIRRLIVTELTAKQVPLTEIAHNDLYTLFEIR